MTNGEMAFMALAEELNFTRAAERIFMSQQGLSDHIKRLEKEYEAVLVNRKPEVSLTAAGKELKRALISKQAMEQDLKRNIADIEHGDTGYVRVGISSSRVRVFSSDIIQRFHYEHPGVRLTIIAEPTNVLLSLLEQGKLDVVIGVDPSPVKGLSIEPIFDDPLYVAVPEHLALERTGDDDLVDLHLYQDVPFIRDLHDNLTVSAIDSYLAQNNIHLNDIISINDYNEQAALCSRLDGAMFCSKSFAFFTGGEIVRKGLRILGIKGFTHSLAICLITADERVYPRCVDNFIEVARESLTLFSENHIK